MHPATSCAAKEAVKWCRQMNSSVSVFPLETTYIKCSVGFLSLTTIEADVIYMFGCSCIAVFLFTQLFHSDLSIASPQRMTTDMLQTTPFFVFQQTMICLFFALAAWIRRQQCQSDGLPTTLQTELSIWWIAIKLCRDIHGFHWPFCSDFGDPLIWRPIGLTSLGQTEMSHVVQCVCPRRFHLVPLTGQNCCALLISKC